MSSKNQITVPSVVRERLNTEPGDHVGFSYDEASDQIVVSNMKKDSLLSLFGSMPPKGDKNQKKWDQIRKEARDERFTYMQNNREQM